VESSRVDAPRPDGNRSLVGLFDSGRARLEELLAQAEDIRQAQLTLIAFVDRIQPTSEQGLTVHQIPLARGQLRVLRQTIPVLEATWAEVWKQPELVSAGPSLGRRIIVEVVVKLIQVLVATGLIVSLITAGAWMGFVLACLLIASGVFELVRRYGLGVHPWLHDRSWGRIQGASEGEHTGQASTKFRTVVRIDPPAVTDRLRAILCEIDEEVNAVLAPTTTTKVDSEREIERLFPKVVDLFHDLLSASPDYLDDIDELKKLARGRVRWVLKDNGIDVLDHPPPPEYSTLEGLYERQETDDPAVGGPRVMYPALARKTQVVREGRILVPANGIQSTAISDSDN
jgi:hypothetical protein